MKTIRPVAIEQKERAFTTTELVVVLAVVALLILIRLPAFAKASNQTKRAQCASNLRQFTHAMHIFADENDDKLPSSGIYWPWDLPSAVGTFVESTGSKWTIMYCPGTGPRFSEADNRDLYNYAGYRVLGYANTFPGNSLAATNWNTTLTPPSIQIAPGQYVTPTTSERVLLADATLSEYGQGAPSLRYNYNYTSIQGGFRLPHLSPHLSGRFPVGGNLGMVDGHVEWREFADMNPRTTGGSPVFWW